MRRALTPEQLSKLLGSVPPYRRAVYLTAALTGLRKDELRKLVWGDVFLNDDAACIRLTAKNTKARRADVLPLNAEMVELLRHLKPADAKATDRVFPIVPKLATYQKDLEAADIPYRDEDGRQADFHALRVAYGTMLARNGVPIRTAMELMRHTDIRLTTKVYTDPALLDTFGAVETLPRLAPPAGAMAEAISDDVAAADRVA